MITLKKHYDIAVIGGGMAGICAALAAARMGAKTVLIQDRPVLGGNASSEIRMHIVGATRHGARANLRETGIIEELLLENKYRNPQHSYGLFDTLLWEKAQFQENLDLYLNTSAASLTMEGRRIQSVSAFQMTTETYLTVTAEQFIDCTGDGLISRLAGAEYMFGRESRDTFGEPNAVEVSDTVTMGNSIQFRALDAGHPVPFERPAWAYDFSQTPWAKDIVWAEITSGYWWLEVGGTKWNVVNDAELTRDEMLKIIFGLWDYIKNYSDKKEEARNFYIDWVSFLPAKRESRRIIGDYVLKEQDVLENRRFADAIAYGGWHLDTHRPEGFYAFVNKSPIVSDPPIRFDGVYTIPYRSIYARDVDNLYLGGRILSASHRAFSSARVMATCAVEGQAAGVAAFLALREHLTARENGKNIHALQQELLKQGCYIPGIVNEDERDLARRATVSADSFLPGGEPDKVTNGISRPVDGESNMWRASMVPGGAAARQADGAVSDDAAARQADGVIPGGAAARQPAVTLQWDAPQKLSRLYLTFDSNLSVEIMISLSHWHHVRQAPTVPDTLVKDYRVEYLLEGSPVLTREIRGNHQRLNVIEAAAACDAVRITVLATHGCPEARICEIRAYGEDVL